MRRTLAIIAALGAGLSGLIWHAARSDFRFRGCPEIDRAEWDATANCADGWFAMVFFGGSAVALGVAAVWLVVRRHA